MNNNDRLKKRVVPVVFIWALFLVIIGIGLAEVQRGTVYEQARAELLDQAEIVAKQFPNMVDTDFFTKETLQGRLISEVKAISYVLGSYEDIGEAREFLEDIVNTTEIKNIWIYDRKGNIVFGSGAAPVSAVNPEDISYLLDSGIYESAEKEYNEKEKYTSIMYYLGEDKNTLVWGVKDQYLIYVEAIYTNELKDTVQLFSLDHMLQEISIVRNGVVLGISEYDGSVLSYPDASFKGKPLEDLNIRLAANQAAASFEQLSEAFRDTGVVASIEVDSVPYYATRADIDDDLFLVMFPVKAVEKEVLSETLVLMGLLLLITGIAILFVVCLAAESAKGAKRGGGRMASSLTPIGKLKIFAILAIPLMLIITFYLETHLMYARMFKYTSATAEDVMLKKHEIDQTLKDVQEWTEKGNLEKCRIARCAVQHAAGGNADRRYISELADCLDVTRLYVFDKQGSISATNAPDDGFTIDKDSHFRPLLEGEDSVVWKPEQDAVSDTMRQEAGVTMIDESNWVEGAVVIADDVSFVLQDHLSFDVVFRRVFLKDDTVVMVIDSENKGVKYFAQVDGQLIAGDDLPYDYTQYFANDLGIDENMLRDYYSGEFFAINNQYFATVRRSEDSYLMVLLPLTSVAPGSQPSVILAIAAILLFFVLLIYAVGKLGIFSQKGDEADHDNRAEEAQRPDTEQNGDDLFFLLESITNSDKPYFEDRWPSDGKKWRDKTPEERFFTATKLICAVTLALIFASVIVAGKDSVWYYCFTVRWSSGINLYSVTSCIVSCILLVALDEVIHKVLFLIARCASRRGETICHLLNSFTGYILFIVGFFVVLATLGVNVAAMSVTAGVAGVIFGIGCQNVVADMLAGIIMAFEGIAHAGDFVSYNGKLGVIQTIGVRTLKLKWYGEITVIRNNEFKNFVNMPGDSETRVTLNLYIDLKESLTRVESIIDKEITGIRDRIAEEMRDDVRVRYRGVNDITDSGIKLSFAVFCQGMNFGWARRLLCRELLLMCERNGIQLAMPQVVVNERGELHTVSAALPELPEDSAV